MKIKIADESSNIMFLIPSSRDYIPQLDHTCFKTSNTKSVTVTLRIFTVKQALQSAAFIDLIQNNNIKPPKWYKSSDQQGYCFLKYIYFLIYKI